MELMSINKIPQSRIRLCGESTYISWSGERLLTTSIRNVIRYSIAYQHITSHFTGERAQSVLVEIQRDTRQTRHLPPRRQTVSRDVSSTDCRDHLSCVNPCTLTTRGHVEIQSTNVDFTVFTLTTHISNKSLRHHVLSRKQ